MGMDVHGVNPKIRKESANVLFNSIPEDKDWFDKWNSLSEDDKDEYFKAKQKHEDDNPGIYFRNNVWWWRPLWDFTCYYVGCLTDKDHQEGHSNGGHIISANKAKQIAVTLKELLEGGEVNLYKAWHENQEESSEYKYPFNEDNVKAFANFCKDSGGFQIC